MSTDFDEGSALINDRYRHSGGTFCYSATEQIPQSVQPDYERRGITSSSFPLHSLSIESKSNFSMPNYSNMSGENSARDDSNDPDDNVGHSAHHPIPPGVSSLAFNQRDSLDLGATFSSAQFDASTVAGSLEPEEDALEYMVRIPECEHDKSFSFRKLWAFTGPGFLMSIAYLDPGNIESDLQSGAVAKYQLLWVLLSSHILGFLLQRLSARLGVVTGRHMAEMAYEFYPRLPRLALWIMIEVAIIVSDMQEVIGTAIAFYLLSNGRIPLFAGVLITMFDTFTFLLIDRYGFRKLEAIFALLISTMAVAFGYEFFIVKPDVGAIAVGMFVPWCRGCGQSEFLQAISIVGAVIMPHNLYLHSALVKSRRINRREKHAVTEANLYYFIESGVALLCSFFINLFVVAVFAHGLFGQRNMDVLDKCADKPDIFPDARKAFGNNTALVEADIYKGGLFLGCAFGLPALYIWGVGIMAAGQSSTMTGTYAGQFVMEGFLHIRWPRWLRVFVTRAIAIVPTLAVALMADGVGNLTGMNDFLNRVQMIQLPFALLPVITFTSHAKIMFEYRSTRAFQLFAFSVSLAVIAINMFYIFSGVAAQPWYAWVGLIAGTLVYMAFVVYLVYICLQSMEIVGTKVDDGQSCRKFAWLHRSDERLTVRPTWRQTYLPVTSATTNTASLPVKSPLAVDGANALSSGPNGVENAAFSASSSTLNRRAGANDNSAGGDAIA